MSATNNITTVILTIVLSIILVSIANVGLSLFIDRPQWDDYCTYENQEERQIKPLPDGCQEEFNQANKEYNDIRFYIFAILGFVLVIAGIFIAIPLIKWTSLISGTIIVSESIIFNLNNKIAVFIALILLFLAIIITAVKVLRR